MLTLRHNIQHWIKRQALCNQLLLSGWLFISLLKVMVLRGVEIVLLRHITRVAFQFLVLVQEVGWAALDHGVFKRFWFFTETGFIHEIASVMLRITGFAHMLGRCTWGRTRVFRRSRTFTLYVLLRVLVRYVRFKRACCHGCILFALQARFVRHLEFIQVQSRDYWLVVC